MKKWLALAAVALVATSSFGAAMFQDTSEIAVSGLIDFFTRDGVATGFRSSFGYYVIDYVELGPRLSFYNDGDRSEWALGIQGEYDLDTGTEFVPFFGFAMDYAQVKDETPGVTVITETGEVTEGEIDGAALVIEFQAGCKYFVTENIALSATFAFDWATDKIYVDGDKSTPTDARIDLGFRFFF